MADLELSSCCWTCLRCPWLLFDSFAVLLKDPRVPYTAAPYCVVIPATPFRFPSLAGSWAGPCKHCGSRSDRVQNAMTVRLLLRCSVEEMVVSGEGLGSVGKMLAYILDLQSRPLWNRLDSIHRKSSAWKTRPCCASLMVGRCLDWSMRIFE